MEIKVWRAGMAGTHFWRFEYEPNRWLLLHKHHLAENWQDFPIEMKRKLKDIKYAGYMKPKLITFTDDEWKTLESIGSKHGFKENK